MKALAVPLATSLASLRRRRGARPCHQAPATRHQLTGQLPLLVAIVGITAGGPYLLFAA